MADLESLRDIPGFKAILQSVLKSQIQLLLEQLSQNTGEESFILTASVNDGTLSHLGSKTGKGFLAGKQEIKSQFLGYCMKTHHKPATPDVPQSFQSGQPHSPLLQPYTDGMKKPRSSTPKGQPRASPYARPFSEKARRQSYQDTSDASFQNPVTSQSDSEGQDHTHSRDSTIVVKQESGDSVTVARGDTLTMPTDGGRPNVPSYPSPSVPFPSSLGLSHTQTSSEQTNAESNSRSDRNSESDQNESSTNNDAGEGGEFNSSVKIEPITENEMELEITGVEMADGSLSSDQWGQLAYAEGDNSYMNQGADQLQYTQSVNLSEAELAVMQNSTCGFQQTKPVPMFLGFCCQFCGRRFGSKVDLTRHTRTHTGDKPFPCPFCNTAFRLNHHLKNHIVRKHRTEVQTEV